MEEVIFLDTMNLIVAANIRRLREERNLSMEELARLSGVSKSMLAQVAVSYTHLDVYKRQAFYEGKSEDEAYRGYFEATLKRLSLLDCYDSVGHVDYVVRYGPNKNRFYTYEKFADVLDEILKTIIRKGKALECNTGGYKYRPVSYTHLDVYKRQVTWAYFSVSAILAWVMP